MKVKFLELSHYFDDHIMVANVGRVLSSGYYLLGNELQAFEKSWASYVSQNHCIGVANGLDALFLALVAAGVGPGDEVIVPSNTYIASWLSITRTGAAIKPVEPDPETFILDVDSILNNISDKTKAVMPVHLYGNVFDIKELRDKLPKEILIIDDSAQSHGALSHTEPAGKWADINCWSFYPGKNLGAAGDAGAITTSNNIIAERIKALRNYGSHRKYVNDILGYNSRLDELQATILSTKLPKLENEIQRRNEIADLYNEGLKGIGNLKVMKCSENSRPAYHLYPILVNNRDEIQKKLMAADIETIIHYPIPPHKQLAYKEWNHKKFPIAEKIAQTTLSLPIGPHLTNEQIEYVISAVEGAVK